MNGAKVSDAKIRISWGPLSHCVGVEKTSGEIVVVAAFRDETSAREMAKHIAEITQGAPEVKAVGYLFHNP
jgi:hypothetical protein